MTDDGLE